jgi:hypothetical protein
MRPRQHAERGVAALPAAVLALAVAGALAAAVAELAGTEVTLVHRRRAAAAALAAADACLAHVLGALPAGWDFDPLVAGPADGLLDAPAGCAVRAATAPGPVDPPRVLLDAEAEVPGGRRTLAALVGRDPIPGVPAVLWLSTAPPPGSVAGTLALDGEDVADLASAAWAALAAPAEPAELDAWVEDAGSGLVQGARTAPPIAATAPPLDALALRVRNAGPAGAEALVAAGTPPPALALVEGDLLVADARRGAGLLFVTGALDIRGALDFTGLVVAQGGVRVAGGADLAVAGALWTGAPAAAGAALLIDGAARLRLDRAALAEVDARLSLPRRAALLGVRDVP